MFRKHRSRSVILDLSCLSSQYTGTVVYASYILKALSELRHIDKIILSTDVDLDFFNQLLNERGVSLSPIEICNKRVHKFGLLRELDFLALKYIYRELKNSDFLYVPTEKFPLSHVNGIVTFHAARAFEPYSKKIFKSKSKVKRNLLKLYSYLTLKKANKVVVVSKVTKEKIKKIIANKLIRISVLHNVIESNSQKYFNKKKIVLCVADYTKPHKNWVETYKLLKFLNCLGYNAVVVSKINKLIISDLALIDGRLETSLTKSQLDKLYCQAEVFVNLSKYEGFGIPLVEAAQAKCKIVCSNLDVFKEVLFGYDFHILKRNYKGLEKYLSKDRINTIYKNIYSYENMLKNLNNALL